MIRDRRQGRGVPAGRRQAAGDAQQAAWLDQRSARIDKGAPVDTPIRHAAADEAQTPLALVCGGGTLPAAVAQAAERHGRRVVTLFPVTGWAEPSAVEGLSGASTWVALVQAGRFFKLMRQEGCRDIVFTGTAVRPPFSTLRIDWETLRALPGIWRAYRGGDDHLLSTIAGMLAGYGFRVVAAHEIAPEILIPMGPLAARAPSERDQADIARGLALLHAMGPFDVGQAVIVADNHVLGVEAAEGTDGLLARVADLRRGGPHFDAGRRRRADQGAEARAGPPLRPAGNRPADHRGRRQGGPCRHRGRCRRRDPGRGCAGGAGGGPREGLRGRRRRRAAMSAPATIHLVAAEESGDILGAALMRALRAISPEIQFSGVGGRSMAREGIVSPFPIEDLSIIGIGAIAGKLPLILRRIRETAAAVVAARPDALVIIDSPDFTHRVARKARRAAPDDPDHQPCAADGVGLASMARAGDAPLRRRGPRDPAVRARRRTGVSTGRTAPMWGTRSASVSRRCARTPWRRSAVLADPPLVLVLPGSRNSDQPPARDVRRRALAQAAAVRRAARAGAADRAACRGARAARDGRLERAPAHRDRSAREGCGVSLRARRARGLGHRHARACARAGADGRRLSAPGLGVAGSSASWRRSTRRTSRILFWAKRWFRSFTQSDVRAELLATGAGAG